MITAAQAKRVRLIALDVDGVLTDNGIWIGPIAGERVELKRFDIQDGLGLAMLRYTDIEAAWLSGRHSEATELRARELRIPTLIQEDKARKLPAMERLLAEKGIAWDELAYVGDDLPDLPVLRRAGLPISVANATREAKEAAQWVTTAPGGHGAVREIVEGILRAVELLKSSQGRVIVTGIGKSGLIARKIAATLTSTGTPASWLHPVDSLHGDLGAVGPSDVAIVLSKSGETDELVGLLGALQRLQVPVIAITGDGDSTLARAAAVVLDAGVPEEACPHDLAPTTSTTVALALGDALAVTLLEEKGFAREDFARLHPGGRLGKRLLLRVSDVMQPAPPLLAPSATMREAVVALAHHRGMAMVGTAGRLAGVLTAGDLSRVAEKHPDFLALRVDALMTRTPRTCRAGDFAAAAVGVMERDGIMALPALSDDETVAGVVHLHDLMRAGAV